MRFGFFMCIREHPRADSTATPRGWLWPCCPDGSVCPCLACLQSAPTGKPTSKSLWSSLCVWRSPLEEFPRYFLQNVTIVAMLRCSCLTAVHSTAHVMWRSREEGAGIHWDAHAHAVFWTLSSLFLLYFLLITCYQILEPYVRIRRATTLYIQIIKSSAYSTIFIPLIVPWKAVSVNLPLR